MEGMTDEQKEYEAMKLVNMFDRLSRLHIVILQNICCYQIFSLVTLLGTPCSWVVLDSG